MGIFGLVSYWGTLPSFTSFKSQIFRKNGPSKVDSLLIDMNGILHNKTKGINMENIDQYFKLVTAEITHLVMKMQPSKNLILAIDGVAPVAKIEQQRMRRYKSAMDRIPNTWDSNAITPGTSFMIALDERFRKWLENKKARII